jgi:hypothetical protein
MKTPGRRMISRRVITYEVSAFSLIILTIWLDEILDIPHLLWGAVQTPINWSEALFESVIISILATAMVSVTWKLFQQMQYLEGLLPICASCKRIRDNQGSWKQIETYVRDRSEAEFSHGICPECAKKLYPEFDLSIKND